MSKTSAGIDRYTHQRPKVTPPHVALGDLRAAVGLTLDQLADRIAEVSGEPAPAKGTLSAIENGHRGASPALLEHIALAYGLRPDAITTAYEPRAREPRTAVA